LNILSFYLVASFPVAACEINVKNLQYICIFRSKLLLSFSVISQKIMQLIFFQYSTAVAEDGG
jgi:hypothetical protein